ncbi:MAG: HAD family hydrolase [Ruminococcaceae bacterium]|nr:HAD family hydrolase [Oscillospiraceae bacterium]
MKKDMLFCVDSDGCVFDAMTPKHRAAFGPALVEVYGLEHIRTHVLAVWDRINLTDATRGINRFLGLAYFFARMQEQGFSLPDTAHFCAWANSTPVLGEAALSKAISQADGAEREQLTRALQWSERVNDICKTLTIRPFAGVERTLALIHGFADIAVVSSANEGALKREWGEYGLEKYVNFMGHQGMGSKADMLRIVLNRGYSPQKCVMCGDALSDLAAAKEVGAQFYPILPFDEVYSWNILRTVVAEQVKNGAYHEGEYVAEFRRRLNAN